MSALSSTRTSIHGLTAMRGLLNHTGQFKIRGYADMEHHYGFVADPAREEPLKHKGKVERTVPIVRKHLLAGRAFLDITDASKPCPYLVQRRYRYGDSWDNKEKTL